MRRGHGDKQLVQTGNLIAGSYLEKTYLDVASVSTIYRPNIDNRLVVNIDSQYSSLGVNAWSRAKLHFNRLNSYGSYDNYLGYVVIEKPTDWVNKWGFSYGAILVWPRTYSDDSSAWCGICDYMLRPSHFLEEYSGGYGGSSYMFNLIETYMNPNAGTIDVWGQPSRYGIVHREPYTPGTILRVTGEVYGYV